MTDELAEHDDGPVAALAKFISSGPSGDALCRALAGTLSDIEPVAIGVYLAWPDLTLSLAGWHGQPERALDGHYALLPRNIDLPVTVAFRSSQAVLAQTAGCSDQWPLLGPYEAAAGDARHLGAFPLLFQGSPIGVLWCATGQAIPSTWAWLARVEAIVAMVAAWARIAVTEPTAAAAGWGSAHLRHAWELSSRQQAILALVRDGLTNAQIGARLGYSPSTVKQEISAMMAMLGAADRVDAARRGEAAGLLAR